MMELQEKIASIVFDAPLNPSDRACHDIADAILALPEIRDALMYYAELGPINHELAGLVAAIAPTDTRSAKT